MGIPLLESRSIMTESQNGLPIGIAPENPPSPPVPTVYVVDDDDAVRDSLKVLMGMFGIPVQCFPSAEEFLAVCRTDWIGLLFIDLRMPGMGGFRLIEQLDYRGSRLPVAVISGHLDEEQISESSGSYPVTILEKPFAVERLKEILRRHFTNSSLD